MALGLASFRIHLAFWRKCYHRRAAESAEENFFNCHGRLCRPNAKAPIRGPGEGPANEKLRYPAAGSRGGTFV